MDQATINRYQTINPDTGQPGDIYAQLLAKYGQSAADAIAQAALSGDETQINTAMSQAMFGNPLNTSTASILANQLETDPLAAPLADANSLISASVLSFLKNPWVIAVIVVGFFFFLGGADFLRRKLKGNS